MLFKELGFSDGTLCAAVARAIVHDAAQNTLGTGCFPKITARHTDDRMRIEISTDHKTISFEVTEAEATRMVETLRKSEQYDVVVFDRIQEAVAQLEGGVAK